MVKKIAALCLCLLPLVFCGCWDQQIFEENIIILSAGLTKAEDEVLYTFVYEGGNAKETKLAMTNIKSDFLSHAMIKANRVSAAPFRSGKLQNFLISEEIAREGFTKLINDSKMEEVNRFIPDYVITECEPAEIYRSINQMKMGTRGFNYLEFLIKSGADGGFCPDIYARDYDVDLLNEDPDPVLPMLDLENGKPVVTGTALFQDEKMVGKFNSAESAFLQLIMQEDTNFSYTLTMPQSESDPVLFQTHRCNSNVDLKREGDQLHIYINADIKGFFDKVVWTEMLETHSFDTIKAYTTNFFEQRTLDTFLKMQALNVDPLGVKGMIKGYYSDFAKYHDIEEAYANADVTVTADLLVENSDIP